MVTAACPDDWGAVLAVLHQQAQFVQLFGPSDPHDQWPAHVPAVMKPELLTSLCADWSCACMTVQMIVEPELRVADFAKAGADIISVHAEQTSTIHLHR